MSRTMSFALFSFFLVSPMALGQEWAAKMFETNSHNFGTVARSAKAEHRFVFTNLYMEDVHVAGVRSSCGCTSVRVETPNLKTYEKGAVVATFNTGTFQGKRGATLTVTFDRPYPAEVQLRVDGFIRSDVLVNPGSVQFGSVDQGSPAAQKVTVNYSGYANWRIVGVTSNNPHIQASVAETARNGGQAWYELSVQMDEQMPIGYLNDHVMLLTNDQQTTQIPVQVEGRVLSSVTVSPTSLFMGVVQPGQKVTKQLVVQGKQPFRIVSISCDDDCFQFGKDQGAKPLHVIPVTFAAGKDLGKILKTIHIETDLGGQAQDLSAYAVVTQDQTAGTNR